ncbi:MliC family protein [Bartonella sp. WD12.1]|uniref:MliC family protein n=1 Tax=Bartonella sp. WD12.1 TaxID=1933903 RepID=UPI000999F06E|nr:MliC family protein [Bartonella sp. WD12.1]OPB30343.1 Membrane-bound inhibitor of C-type lysozyme [Bartonella sp. WD12.1]
MKKILPILGLFALGAFVIFYFLFNKTNIFSNSLVIGVPSNLSPTKETIVYQCSTQTNRERLKVTYLNVGNISLVDFTWKGERIVGANVISASGSKYAGAQYIWWATKNEAALYDLINDPNEEKPIMCEEERNTN